MKIYFLIYEKKMPFILIENYSIPSENIIFIELHKFIDSNEWCLKFYLKNDYQISTNYYGKNEADALLKSVTKELNSFQLPKQA